MAIGQSSKKILIMNHAMIVKGEEFIKYHPRGARCCVDFNFHSKAER